MNQSEGVQSNTLQLGIAASIIEHIREQGLGQGERLSERGLANTLGVSRSPIRVALTLLAERGIVELKPNTGWYVAAQPLSSAGAPIAASGHTADLASLITRDRFRGQIEHHFSEADFIKRYNVSRGDLRKALISLSQDGMIERARGHGWRFLPMLDNPAAQRASYDFRIAIETASLLSSTFELNKARLERVKAEHERMRTIGGGRCTGSDIFELNAGFHLMLAEFSGNEFFVQAITHQNRLRRVIEYFVEVSSARLIDSCNEHLAIMDALEQGDARWAASLMERHLSTARDRLIGAQETGTPPANANGSNRKPSELKKDVKK